MQTRVLAETMAVVQAVVRLPAGVQVEYQKDMLLLLPVWLSMLILESGIIIKTFGMIQYLKQFVKLVVVCHCGAQHL